MSKRLQVLFDEEELREIQRAARAQRMTVAEWVRQALRDVRRRTPTATAERKLAVVREAARYTYPAGDVEEMLGEIERGYLDDGP